MPMAWVPDSRSKFGLWMTISRHYNSWNITEYDDTPRKTKTKPNLPTLLCVFENVHYNLLIVQWGHTRSRKCTDKRNTCYASPSFSCKCYDKDLYQGVKRFLDDTSGVTRQYTTACYFYFLNISLASLI